MGVIGSILGGVGFVGFVVCFIMVLIQMFKRGQTGLGIACIVLICCGVGALVAYVFGWIKSSEWGLKNVMIAWTVFWVLAAIGGALGQSYLMTLVPVPAH